MEDVQLKRNLLLDKKKAFEAIAADIDDEVEKLESALHQAIRKFVEEVKALKVEPSQRFLADATAVETQIHRFDDAMKKATVVQRLMNEFREQCSALTHCDPNENNNNMIS